VAHTANGKTFTELGEEYGRDDQAKWMHRYHFNAAITFFCIS
jgi:hypothetical protein